MKDVVIFEDGKLGRGSKAKLIKRGNKRVLIQFTDYDFEKEKDVVITEWFKVFIPFYKGKNTPSGKYKYNNKRHAVHYLHERSNMFYSDARQTESFKEDLKQWMNEDYFNSLFK
tara:strand:+ start:3319 stop:3660 length:342 start_codon:yes stop_codon:yes gene_type:complete